jgi:hypothetical protein
VQSFDLVWSGVPNGNTANATAVIQIDAAAIPNPGADSDPSSIPSWCKGITLTVADAASGNGTFTLSDFFGLVWDTEGGTLDFGMELVGQPTDQAPWGTTHGGTSGDFNLFGASSAPSGTNFFQLTTDGGDGDRMDLISFAPAPVPEPRTVTLVALASCAGLLLRRRRK